MRIEVKYELLRKGIYNVTDRDGNKLGVVYSTSNYAKGARWWARTALTPKMFKGSTRKAAVRKMIDFILDA